MSPAPVVVGVELDREPVLDTGDPQAAAVRSDGVGATGIVMEHHGRPVGAAVVGAQIDIEGDGKVLAHIDAPRRHRRAGLLGCRRQGEDVVRDARAPVRRQRHGAGRRGDRHADLRGSRRRAVGDRVGKAARTAEARGGGIRDRVVALDRCDAAHEVRHAGDGEGIVLGIAVISKHGNVDRSARRRRRRIGIREGGLLPGGKTVTVTCADTAAEVDRTLEAGPLDVAG